MNNSTCQNAELVSDLYARHSATLLRFIAQRVNCMADAENLAHDVWMKMLECEKPLNAESVKGFMFTIARNTINDYLRHIYIAENVHADLMNSGSIYATDVESEVSARDLAEKELERVCLLPTQRQLVYRMSRYDGLSIDEISEATNLSGRTIENHLRMGRRDVRQYIVAIA